MRRTPARRVTWPLGHMLTNAIGPSSARECQIVLIRMAHRTLPVAEFLTFRTPKTSVAEVLVNRRVMELVTYGCH